MINIINLIFICITVFLIISLLKNKISDKFLLVLISTIITIIIISQINLNKIIGGSDDDLLCNHICKNEDNPKSCLEICENNNFIYTKIRGGSIDDDDLLCKKICKNSHNSLNCVDDCKIDLKTL